jgi:bilin biosynthesis protein
MRFVPTPPIPLFPYSLLPTPYSLLPLFVMTQDALFDQLKHPNPNLRQRAMLELAEIRDETTIPRLMAALDEEDVVFRRASVQALGVIGVDSVPSLIVALETSENPTVRASCAKALAQVAVNHPEVTFPDAGIEGLTASMADPNPVVHIASVMALGEIGSPAFEPLVTALKSTDNPALAVSIVNSLGSMGDDRAAVVLNELIQDRSIDAYVREVATSAASRLDQVMKYERDKAAAAEHAAETETPA